MRARRSTLAFSSIFSLKLMKYIFTKLFINQSGGVNMRGDQKWPPQSVKEAVAAENDARVSLAKGPACRPRKVSYISIGSLNCLSVVKNVL